MRISYEDLYEKFNEVLIKKGVDEEEANLSAKIFADNSLDGIYTHGVNRFPLFIEYIDKGYIKIENKSEKTFGLKGYEIWDGKLAIGNINAKKATDRAMELAKEYGIGVVGLKNTSHWMRGGYYGWQAANEGYALIAWTNTMPNMQAWGGSDINIGNNPMVIAVPREDNNHVVVDTAFAQFSYGKLEEYRLKGEELPIIGGYDTKGNLTKNPGEIEKSMGVLPIGYWKGSSVSIGLDLLGASISGGNTVSKIGEKYDEDLYVTQTFICIDVNQVESKDEVNKIIEDSILNLKNASPTEGNIEVRYPGERAFRTREENSIKGIPVDERVWEKIKSL